MEFLAQMAATPDLPLLFSWMDPQWWLDRFGEEMFYASVLIVFIECGLLFPLLPGDSLLFSIGLFIKRGDLGVDLLPAMVILVLAAFAGNVVGYEIGRRVGPSIFEREGRFLNSKNYNQTHAFFERYGARALVLGRFVPIVRTFITVVAGAGRMDRKHFWTWSFVGAAIWVISLTLIGYFVGTNDLIENNLEAALLVIVAISVLPMVFEYAKHRRANRRATATPAQAQPSETEL